jgi:hypothetical protein
MRRWVIAIASLVALLGGIAGAQAGVVIVVNKSTQRLSVSVDGAPRYEWPVSTAREGYNTPNGTYGVERMEVSWFSRRYDWSPMPHSIFFNGGYAIHGSYEIKRLGSPASHGCIRLHPENATVLYRLVEQNRGATRIIVTGDRPSGVLMSSARSPRYAEDPAPRPVRTQRARNPVYVEDDGYRPPRSRTRRHARSFEDIFDQADDETPVGAIPEQDAGAQQYRNR